MIMTLLILQIAAAVVSAETRERYEPFRQCLTEQARLVATPEQADEAILEQARSNCMAANLASGSAALFAEIRSGATREQALERVARLRLEVEQEALVAARAPKIDGETVAHH